MMILRNQSREKDEPEAKCFPAKVAYEVVPKLEALKINAREVYLGSWLVQRPHGWGERVTDFICEQRCEITDPARKPPKTERIGAKKGKEDVSQTTWNANVRVNSKKDAPEAEAPTSAGRPFIPLALPNPIEDRSVRTSSS